MVYTNYEIGIDQLVVLAGFRPRGGVLRGFRRAMPMGRAVASSLTRRARFDQDGIRTLAVAGQVTRSGRTRPLSGRFREESEHGNMLRAHDAEVLAVHCCDLREA